MLNTFIINKLGMCRVFDLSLNGISFGCSSREDIPEEFVFDIIDDRGLHLMDVPVETVWIKKNEEYNTAALYTAVAGAKFKEHLTNNQLESLERFLKNPI